MQCPIFWLPTQRQLTTRTSKRLQPRPRRRNRPVQQALRLEIVVALRCDRVQAARVAVESVAQPGARASAASSAGKPDEHGDVLV